MSGSSVEASSRSIFAEVVKLQAAGRTGVLAMPLWRRGSVPVGQYAKLLLRDDGSTAGTVGGGALEAEVLRVAPEVLVKGKPRVLEFDLTATEAAATGMICGGRCAILLEPIGPGEATEVFAAAAQAEAAGEPIAVVTVLRPGEGADKLAVTAEGVRIGTTGDAAQDAALVAEALAALSEQRPRYREAPVPVQVEPLLPRPSVFIFGAGHIAVPLAQMAEMVGFRVVVIDDRAEFANRERFPRADEVVVAEVGDAFRRLGIGEDSYLVAITRGHLLDEEVVAHALRTRGRYLGMIGSKRKVAAVKERLRQRGFTEEELARVHAPIGLAIGADTVEEIAVSIVAELIKERRQPVGRVEGYPAGRQAERPSPRPARSARRSAEGRERGTPEP